jgi:hypothetical protein
MDKMRTGGRQGYSYSKTYGLYRFIAQRTAAMAAGFVQLARLLKLPILMYLTEAQGLVDQCNIIYTCTVRIQLVRKRHSKGGHQQLPGDTCGGRLV